MGLGTTREAEYARERERNRQRTADAPRTAEEVEQARRMVAYLALSPSQRAEKRARARTALEYPLDKPTAPAAPRDAVPRWVK